MQKAINSVASENLRPLERGKGSPDLVFDAIECIVKCKKCLITRPKKEESLHWCLDFACWDKKQEDHRSAIAAEAKKKAAAEITSKATGAPPPKIISQEISATSDMVEAIQKSYSLQEVIDPDKGTIKDPFMYNQEPYVCIAQSLPEEHVTKFKCYKLTYPDDFEGEAKPYTAVLPEEHAKSPKGFYHGVLVNWLKEPVVLEGPEVTFVYKSEESKQQPQKEELKEYRMFHKDGSSGGSIESISPVQAMIDLKGNPTEGDILKAKSPGGGWSKFKFTDADLDTMACASKPPLQPAKPDVPPEVLDKAKKEAGTRAEPFDIGIASTGTFKVIGDDLLPWTKIDNPEECQKTCTHGFHYAFNSHSKETEDPNDHYVCTDLACLEKKIFALISKTEDEGKANKELERKAVMEAIEKTKAIDKPRMKLIILSLVRGCYIASKDLPEGIEKAETLVWKSIASDVEEKDRTITKLMKAIDDYPDDELARLITNLSLYSLAYHGDVAKYKIQLTDPLKWMGIKVEGKK
jgi:DNA repair exonuclease SbcCD nuclease subunit